MAEQEQWKSVWGHLEELRLTFIRMVIVIGVGCLAILAFYEPLFQFLISSWKQENSLVFHRHILQYERIENVSTTSHVYELPREALAVRGEGLEWMENHRVRLPPQHFIEYALPTSPRLLILGPLEGLLLTLKICLWLSFALTSPLWGWIFLRFILPGLKRAEKALLLPFILWSYIWAGGGMGFAYFVTIPLANGYLAAFNASIGQNAWSLSSYVDYTLMLGLGHAVAFELSFLLLWMVHFQWLSPEWLIAKRRYMITGAFILGALLTPPDVPSQLMLAVPLIILYEIAVLYGKWKARTPMSILP